MILYLSGLITVALIATTVFWAPKWQVSGLKIDDKDRLSLENELRKTAAQIFGGLAILTGLYFTFEQLTATRKSLEIAQEGQTIERFTRTVEQLGSQQPQVRVGGIYGLGEIAKNSPRDRSWIVVSILVAFARDRAKWQGSTQVRALPEDVQAALSVLTSPDTHLLGTEATKRRTVDLEDTDFRRAYLVGANLEGVDLSRAHLEGADLRGADLKTASLVGSHLDGALLQGSSLSGADLRAAQMSGADVSGARFTGTHLEGVNLSSVIGLSESQIRSMTRDMETILPNGK